MILRRNHPGLCSVLGALVLITSFAAPFVVAQNAAMLAETRAQQQEHPDKPRQVPTTCVVSEQCKMWDRTGQHPAQLRLHQLLHPAPLHQEQGVTQASPLRMAPVVTEWRPSCRCRAGAIAWLPHAPPAVC